MSGFADALRARTSPAIAEILGAALTAVDPHRATVAGIVESELLACPPQTVVVIAIGKAAAPMARALVETLGNRIRGGVVVSKSRSPSLESLTVLQGEHPVPGVGSQRAGEAVERAVAQCGAGDTVALALSGGASALVTAPIGGLSTRDLAATTRGLLRCGADIQAINAVRKHLDRLKGGGLAVLAAPARTVGLVLSDVVGDALPTIGSGPACPDPTTWADVKAALAGCRDPLPDAVLAVVADGLAGRRGETLKEGKLAVGAPHHIIARNQTAVDAAEHSARKLGFRVELGAALIGEARSAGAALGRQISRWRRTGPRAIVLGGETTVTVTGNGQGGRNQEFVVAAAQHVHRIPNSWVASLATDGEDGPTDAAGGFVTPGIVDNALAQGLDADDHLARNDTYAWLAASGGLLRTGSTGTNVGDIVVAGVER